MKRFLGNHEQRIDLLQKKDCRMSLKIQFLHSQFPILLSNIGAVSNEQGKRFHHDIKGFRKMSNVTGKELCWVLKRRDTS